MRGVVGGGWGWVFPRSPGLMYQNPGFHYLAGPRVAGSPTSRILSRGPQIPADDGGPTTARC